LEGEVGLWEPSEVYPGGDMRTSKSKQAGRVGRSASPPIPVRAVDFVMYCTKDLRRTRTFYQKLFGFNRGEEWHGGWSEFATQPLSFCLDGSSKAGKKSVWAGPPAIAFAVADIHAAVAECRRRKVKVLLPPMETNVCWMAFIADPDGNRVCLHQRKNGTAG